MPLTKSNLLNINLNLPNHENELCDATIAIDKLKAKLCKQKALKEINDKIFIALYEDTIKILDYVGKLSKPAFEIENDLEKVYFKCYYKTPELAKKLWLDHYEYVHKNYNTLKNRCFKLLEDLDELYWKCNKKQPPNWKI